MSISEWDNMFSKEEKPSAEQIKEYINNPLWEELNRILIQDFGVSPKLEYSSCSMQRGWNIKYPKKGKNLCTSYPETDYFKLLVVISERNIDEANLFIETCSEYIKNLYKNTRTYNGGKWLMIDVENRDVLEDAIRLIELRA